MVRPLATSPPLGRSQSTDSASNKVSTEAILQLSDSLSWGSPEREHRIPNREGHTVHEHPPVRAISKAFQRLQESEGFTLN